MPPAWTAPATVFEARVDPPTGAPLEEGCQPLDGSSYVELFLRGKTPAAVCPDRAELVADWRTPPPDDSYEEEARARRREREWLQALRERMQEDDRAAGFTPDARAGSSRGTRRSVPLLNEDRRRRGGWRY